MEDRRIHIEFSISEVKKMLIDKTGIQDDIASLIMGHINLSTMGLEQMAKALLGVFPKAKYKEGDFVYVKIKNLPGWKVDKDATAKLECATGDCVMAQITKVDVYSSNPYTANFTAMLNDGKVGQDTAVFMDREIESSVENPEEILEIIENLNKPLPF